MKFSPLILFPLCSLPDRIELGSGNRVIVKGGHLNKKCQITVPDRYE
jgi:hypothetical protein